MDEQTLGLTINRKRKFLKELSALSSSVSSEKDGGRWSLIFFDDLLLVCVAFPKGELVTTSNPSLSAKKGNEKRTKVKFAFFHDKMNLRDLPDLFKYPLDSHFFPYIFLSFLICPSFGISQSDFFLSHFSTNLFFLNPSISLFLFLSNTSTLHN